MDDADDEHNHNQLITIITIQASLHKKRKSHRICHPKQLTVVAIIETVNNDNDIDAMHTGNNRGFILKVFIREFTSTHGTWKQCNWDTN